MKTLLLSLLLASSAAYAQAILRVNNTPGSAAPYTTIAAAVTAAGVNDIIMVEGSTISYGIITINKKVTIIGPGFFLGESLLQATPHPAYVDNITLNSGASGSSISGLQYYLVNTVLTVNSVSNLSILNSCFFDVNSAISLTGTGNNVLIRGNFLRGSARIEFGTSGYTQVLVINNILASINTGGSSVVISNNIFGTSSTITNSIFQNNICISGSSNVLLNTSGSTIKNNVFVGAQTGVDATNLISQPFASLFVGLPGYATETQFKLKAGSPAIGAGVAGTDCGMFGGATPYQPSGIAVGQPTITDYSFPTTVPKNGVLNVKVSGKVN